MPDDVRTIMARAMNAHLEGPIANQDFGRQLRQWERCLDATDAIIAALSEAGMEVQGGWQPIETAPKDGTRVIIARHSMFGWARAIGYYADDHGVAGWVPLSAFADPPGVLGLAHPTHWHPGPALPAPPSGGG